MPAWAQRLGVLRERDYRLLLAGQAVSLLGDAMVNVALAFAVLGAGGSASDIGIVFAARTAALLACLLAGGVVADRLPRRLVLVGADVVRFASQGALAAVLILGSPAIATLAALSALTGAATGVFNPAATGFLPSVVAPEGLQQANALRTLASSAGRIGGPLLAALLVVTASPGWALAVDAATFAVSAALVSRIRLPPHAAPPARSFLADLREGWDAFRSRRWLWTFVLAAAFGNFLHASWSVIGPVLAQRELGGAAAWGAVVAASGAGGVVGGLVALRVRPRRPLLASLLGLVVFFVPVALLAAGTPVVVLAAGAAVGEIGLVLGTTLWESTFQRHVEPAVLSRLSAYDWFGSIALQPLGFAVWGPIAAALGFHEALWLAFGLLMVSIAAALSVRETRTLPAYPQRSAA
ncbi:MAG: hypothetical protein QOF17_482 [Solirubrobacteraceae bacterium]|jgi:MFS family permease|nr:hypothetical protein [Solirubrobacteraceae bacterium]